MNWRFSEDSLARVATLNHASVTKGFCPDTDIDWTQTTTDEEYLALFRGWSLFYDSPFESQFTNETRVAFAKYQQANLMLFSAAMRSRFLAGSWTSMTPRSFATTSSSS